MINRLALFVVALCLSSNAHTQETGNPANVKKIVVTTMAGGMGGSTSATMEITSEGGKWHSYGISRITDRFSINKPINDKLVPKQIASLSQTDVTNLLESITVFKPTFDHAIFNITPITEKTYLKETQQPEIDGPK